MKSQAFTLLLATWLGCMTSLAVALPEDVPAKNEPYPEFRLTGYDMSYCDPLAKQQKKKRQADKNLLGQRHERTCCYRLALG